MNKITIARIMLALQLLVVGMIGAFSIGVLAPTSTSAATIAPQCKKEFLGLPAWYEFLGSDVDPVTGMCRVEFSGGTTNLNVKDFWLIGLAALDIALRIAGLVVGGMIMYGGFRYITTQGDPQAAKAARTAIINALIGLAITLVAVGVVQFVGAQFS
jgi:hypothetical protein